MGCMRFPFGFVKERNGMKWKKEMLWYNIYDLLCNKWLLCDKPSLVTVTLWVCESASAYVCNVLIPHFSALIITMTPTPLMYQFLMCVCVCVCVTLRTSNANEWFPHLQTVSKDSVPYQLLAIRIFDLMDFLTKWFGNQFHIVYTFIYINSIIFKSIHFGLCKDVNKKKENVCKNEWVNKLTGKPISLVHHKQTNEQTKKKKLQRTIDWSEWMDKSQ